MRNNLFHFAYFKAHFDWLHSKTCLQPEVHWPELRQTSPAPVWKTSVELLQTAENIPHISLRNGAENRFLDTAFRTTQWYQGMHGELFVKTFGNGQLAGMSPLHFQVMMGGLSNAVARAESTAGQMEWQAGEVKNGFVNDLVGNTKGPASVRVAVNLSKPVRLWEAGIIITQAIPRIRANQEHTGTVSSSDKPQETIV